MGSVVEDFTVTINEIGNRNAYSGWCWGTGTNSSFSPKEIKVTEQKGSWSQHQSMVKSWRLSIESPPWVIIGSLEKWQLISEGKSEDWRFFKRQTLCSFIFLTLSRTKIFLVAATHDQGSFPQVAFINQFLRMAIPQHGLLL